MIHRYGTGGKAWPVGRCQACAVVAQVTLNLLLLTDLALNTALLGSPLETLSQRAARARRHGSKAAAVFCRVVTAIGRLLGHDADHCTWALETPGSIAQEIWKWSPDTPNPPPLPDDR